VDDRLKEVKKCRGLQEIDFHGVFVAWILNSGCEDEISLVRKANARNMVGKVMASPNISVWHWRFGD
jgi:hypothetical protein